MFRKHDNQILVMFFKYFNEILKKILVILEKFQGM